MGYRDICCRCPEIWAEFVNRWVYVILTNSPEFLLGEKWQLREVQETFIVLRRPVMAPCEWQRIVIPCQHIAALLEALPPSSAV